MLSIFTKKTNEKDKEGVKKRLDEGEAIYAIAIRVKGETIKEIEDHYGAVAKGMYAQLKKSNNKELPKVPVLDQLEDLETLDKGVFGAYEEYEQLISAKEGKIAMLKLQLQTLEEKVQQKNK